MYTKESSGKIRVPTEWWLSDTYEEISHHSHISSDYSQGSFIAGQFPASPGVLVKFLTVKILGRSSLWAGFILPHCLGGDSPWWQCAETPPFSMHQPEESGKHWHSLDFPLCLFYFRPPGHGMAPHAINMGLWSKLPKIRSGVLKGWAWISEACGSLASAPRTSRLGSTEHELLGLARMS